MYPYISFLLNKNFHLGPQKKEIKENLTQVETQRHRKFEL